MALADAVVGVALGAGAMLGIACFAATFELFQDEKPDHHWTCDTAVGLGVGAAATFVAAPVVVHAVHGNIVGVLVSLPLRAAVGALAVYGFAEDSEGLVWGALLAAPAVAIFDWFVLAETPQAEPVGGAALAPTVAIVPDGAALGLRGRF